MEVIILPDGERVAQKAADIVCRMLGYRAGAVLGLATGGTPIALYRELVRRHRAGEVSFAAANAFNLDEYIGVAPEDPISYRRFMDEHLFRHVNIDRARTFFPECAPGEDPRRVGPRYERRIAAVGGIDLQILGIGRNGHIGFNEPGSSLGSRTRVKTLAPRTLQDNSRLLQPGQVQPELAITMGIGTIMEARRILLLATGEHKAAAVAGALEGAITAMHPASVLQAHEHVRVLLDESAASRLELVGYHRWVEAQSQTIAARHGGAGDPWFHTYLEE